jgi:PAS domain S-box-containing protein
MGKIIARIAFQFFLLLISINGEAKNILFLNSYHRGMNWSDEIFDGVKQVVDQYEDINLFTEYMDTKRFTSDRYLDELITLYTQKYKNIPIDAVICADNPALDFVIKHAGNPLFKGFKVYCGVSDVEDYQNLGDDYKGVAEREFFIERLYTIKKILPNIQTVYYLLDKTSSGVIFRQRLEQVIKKPPFPVSIKIMDDIDINELYAFVSSLKDKNSAIDYVLITQDKFGEIVDNDKVGEKIAKISSVPVFSNDYYLLGKGIVGGVYQLGTEQGKGAATICMQLLSGISSTTIPKVSLEPIRTVVDYKIIRKFGLKAQSILQDAILLNYPEKFYIKYKSELLTVITAFIILSFIIIFLSINISKRRLYELSLGRSEQKFRDIAELLPQTIFECDLHGNLTFANKQAFEMFDCTSEEFGRGINITHLFLPEEKEHIKADLALIQKGKTADNPLYIARRKDGTTFPFEVHSSVYYENGKPAGLRGIGINITKQKEVEQELINAREKAEQSDKLKSAFLSNMSHEIRTPLNAIIGFSSLLSDEGTTIEQRLEYKKYILNSSEYLLNLVNDIIDHSRIEAGQLEIIHSEFNLFEVMKELYLNFKSQQKNKLKEHIHFIYENLDETEHIIVMADPVRIKQIVGNLLDNAFKFTDQGSIRFGYTLQKNEQLLITVKDTGIGIGEEDKLLVFRRFYKLCSDNDKLYGGSGLGLSICKNLISLMKGNIWLESEKGIGSSFFVNIPVKVKKYKQVVVSSSSGKYMANHYWPNKIILVAEDEISNFELIKALLKNTGSEILHAKNGKEAVDLALNNTVDVILMDIQMPVLNGYEAIAAIKHEKPDIPIIAQTAYAMAGEKEEILQAGSDAYLAKPIDKVVLLDTIQLLLNQ